MHVEWARSSSIGFVVASACVFAPTQAWALDPGKLSIYQPLTVQDAYPTAAGTVQVQSSARWDDTAEGRTLVELRPVVKWGAFDHFQLSFAAPYRVGDASSSRSGDGIVAGFYQFAEDRGGLPALAASQSVHAYYGGLQGIETVTSLLASKALLGDAAGAEAHLNLSYRRLYGGAADERVERTRVVVGISHVIGPNLAILADVVHQDGRRLGEMSTLVEAGLRHRVGSDGMVSAGIGAGIGNQSPRLRLLVGFQRSFATGQ